MRTRLHRRVNGNTTPSQDSKPTTPAAAPAHSVVNPSPVPPAVNQVPLNNTSTNSTHKASPPAGASLPASVTNSPSPVAPTSAHPSSAPSPADSLTASVPPPASTSASPPPRSSNTDRAPTSSYSTGLASTDLANTRAAVQSNTPETHLGLYADSAHHTSTGVIVAVGLSGVAITLIFLILMRFFVKHMLNKKPKKGHVQECSVTIPPPACAFLDHPKNQEMGGVGASPSAMMNRTVSTTSVRSDASFIKPQEQYLINNFDHSHYEHNGHSNYAVGFHQRPPMEALHHTETLFVQPKSWDGSRPMLASGRSYY
ncbi:hypothetical protein PCANC_01957 [Puccinia coronata f. sp. avenae]|uniref:Uncharacterized protein n=1 Tax=Puccinia coronata f. sp. avenae TaxID=200324 RepID=A0A2N5W4C0_9BASI|nr:hypothetical protein PCASD_00859 [Puccinia coronata f. sp. avenae]PLW57084.1 hypothetical protein PCANC_01957 [Puccinia coronata f. sp. avenae]